MGRVKKEFLDNDSGAVAVYVAIGIVIFLGCAALVLDIGHLESVKRELTKAAEAGALSGARGLWPVNLSTATSRDPNSTDAATKALAAATGNRVNGANLTSDEVTVEVGQWDYNTKQFNTPVDISQVNGVRVTTSRANVQMFLAQVLGQGPRNMQARSVAVMDFVSGVGVGCLPIAVNKTYVENPDLTNPIFINFTPDPSDNAGWFTDPPDPASAKTIKDYIDNAACDPLFVDQIINLQNGNDASCLQDLKTKLDAVNADGSAWIVCLPVVTADKFNQNAPINEFCGFEITEVFTTGSLKGVKGNVKWLSLFQNALPGGGKGGPLAPPKLVEGPPGSGTR